MKKILFITGTRADFGKLKPLINACKDYETSIFATGMHMLERYGMTRYEITKSGFDYYPFINQSLCTPMDITLSNTVSGLSYYIQENPADLMVVHGDRVESLAGAIVGAFNNTLVAHIEGGEVSGTIDESIRHSISKLSHIHFVSNQESADRLKRMGEEYIYVIGSPDIDIMLSELPSLEEVKEKYDIGYKTYSILIYHPVTTEPVDLTLFDEIEEDTRNYIVIYPNNDTGSEKIIQRIDLLKGKRFTVLPSMRFEHFLTLLKNADFIIGNSSAGIREAPVYGVPTIDIGTRQHKRGQGTSIVNCRTREEIREAIKHPPPRTKSYPFGKGNSAELFAKILPEIWEIPLQKSFNEN